MPVLVTDMSSDDLRQAVAPEEAAEHDARLLLVPAKVSAQGDGADGDGDAGAVQQARPQQQHHHPHAARGPAGREQKVRKRPEDELPGRWVPTERFYRWDWFACKL